MIFETKNEKIEFEETAYERRRKIGVSRDSYYLSEH